jgi:hypothetical protein
VRAADGAARVVRFLNREVQHEALRLPAHHPLVGELTLSFESMQLTADPGLTIAVHTAEPGTKSEEALNLLASWAATAAAPVQ